MKKPSSTQVLQQKGKENNQTPHIPAGKINNGEKNSKVFIHSSSKSASKGSGEPIEAGITVKKNENFSEWYTQVVLKSELADYSIVSGCMVIRPLGMAIWDTIRGVVEPRLKKLHVQNSYFPLFIPESLLSKEATHVAGFTPECAWVTHGGQSLLGERLAIRPTSEAIMYDSYSKWVRSWRDLPLKLMQWNNVVRWEFKHPTLLVRTREFLWVEGHTAFSTKEEADAEIKDIMNLWKDVCENVFALPDLHGRKTETEKFAGAAFTESLEFFVPNGRVAQGPDAHSDGQIFAKAYDIKFLDKDGAWKHAWQNTWAITTRMIGILLAVHSDDKGLVLPPALSPTKVVMVPILFDDTKDAVLAKARELQAALSEKYSVELDDREGYTAGYKFNHWELRGVPLRLEIGPKDLSKGSCILVRRDTGEKEAVPIESLEYKIGATLDVIQRNLLARARDLLSKNTITARTWKDLKTGIDNKKLVLASFCNQGACEEKIKAKLEGARTLNIPLEQPAEKPASCAVCDGKAVIWVYIGKSY